ncbi:CoA-transferase [Roseovarius amoyensis]|uniref:CoA-transferase n=1 Tax=Roseovarius amoyensis TaxID=2211448 RepID=UPI000DBE93EE|nr:CoA-transferase [Roseovarius amoyensis]
MTDAHNNPDYAIGELMVSAIARQMGNHDHDWAAVGAYSQLPMASMKLARMIYAPNMWWLAGGGGAINSTSKLVQSTSDHRVMRGAEYMMNMEDIVDIEMWRYNRGREQVVGVVGGIQIDKQGSCNMVAVGDYENPTVRGVGTVGLAFGVSFTLVYFFTMHHNKQVFVDTVDFVSSVGHTGKRAEFVPPACIGPQKVFTPLGVFDFCEDGPDTKTMRVVSLHPGVTLEEVQDKTGFDLIIPDTIAETAAPSDLELTLIRNEIDPDGILKTLRISR